jgi:hypothetical protein
MQEKGIQVNRVRDEKWFYKQLEQWQQAENVPHGQMLKTYLEEVQKVFKRYQEQSLILGKIKKQ